MEDWKEKLKNIDFTKVEGNCAMPVKAKSYTINGEYVVIPDWDDMGNMIFELNKTWTHQYLLNAAKKIGESLAPYFKKIIDRVEKIENKLEIMNSDTEQTKDDVNDLKLELDPQYFIKNVLLKIEPKE
jgi:hypothetical protein